jgi:hypothetical protein
MFSEASVGLTCGGCGQELAEAYETRQLWEAWRSMLQDDDATMEVGYADNGEPVRVTLARPTTPAELYARKYSDISVMESWLQDNLADELVWIEDTFANRNKQPQGNLRDRGRTLGVIAARYSGLSIATRTLAPRVIAATLRDVGSSTDIYLGAERIGEALSSRARSVGYVPDRRTLLTVAGGEVLA